MEHYLEQISIPPCVTNFSSLTQPYIRIITPIPRGIISTIRFYRQTDVYLLMLNCVFRIWVLPKYMLPGQPKQTQKITIPFFPGHLLCVWKAKHLMCKRSY